MVPFINNLYDLIENELSEEYATGKAVYGATNTLLTNIILLKDQPVNVGNNKAPIAPKPEITKLQSKQFIGLAVNRKEKSKIALINFLYVR